MGTFEKSWREACHRLTDMGGDIGLWTWDMGTWDNQADQTAKTWVGRDVQSIIIIWRLIWCMCAHGPAFYHGTCSRWRNW